MTVDGARSGDPAVKHEPARLIIVDDHDFVRAGIKAMLSGEQDLEVVGEATDGHEALDLCGRLRPDLVLMDVRMPRVDGLAATRSIKRIHPEISVLILTMHENEDYLLEAVRAGAAGYVLKDAPQTELVTAIRKVLDGETTLNRSLADRPAAEAGQRDVGLDPESAQTRARGALPTANSARTRGARTRGPGADQQGDRLRLRDQRGHRQEPRRAHNRQAWGLGSHPGRRSGSGVRVDRFSSGLEYAARGRSRNRKYATRRMVKNPPLAHHSSSMAIEKKHLVGAAT